MSYDVKRLQQNLRRELRKLKTVSESSIRSERVKAELSFLYLLPLFHLYLVVIVTETGRTILSLQRMIKALVWCQIVYWSGRLWKKYSVLFQKIEKMAVGGTYESQDSSERKLQRSMTVRSAGSVTRVKDQILVDMRSSGSDDQSYQKIRNRAGSNKAGFLLNESRLYLWLLFSGNNVINRSGSAWVQSQDRSQSHWMSEMRSFG
ncbi:hypothetical protein DY000_02062767 [Brassica cretica]|uniref:Uncharacterized protein n=1 Tax=Brassica cretica TaxID=69181 RepID=A0ABQ7ANL6_BRACR|nr:hypothetical protein DY000_02062767 [Brassica cretica]